ncbi:MAG: hypothetical protein KGN84_03420 [Acidobacteriota bacterium]|nr:hypothetical protein [Acidobacteriota bacterium]
MTRTRKKDPRSGYALLFVYMMAASVAIMLYLDLPRAAFEAQRDKEQLLIDRGEQYKRAVQLYVRKFGTFPADINALENTQNIRFLRRQYTDPMTGKNEWRLIHVGPGGVFTDSKVYGTQNKKDGQGGPQTFIATVNQFAGDSTGNQAVNLATRRRPSDGASGGAQGLPGDPNDPSSGNAAPISGPVMVLPDGRIVPATPTGVPAPTGQTGASGPAGVPGQTGAAPGNPAFAGLPPGAAPPGYGIQSGFGGAPGAPGVPGGAPPLPGQSGFQNTANTPPTAAANLINQILTTPRPGGLNGVGGTDPNAAAGTISSLTGAAPNTGAPIGQTMGGTQIGGGFAGVASKYEQEGVKTYNGKTSYD